MNGEAIAKITLLLAALALVLAATSAGAGKGNREFQLAFDSVSAGSPYDTGHFSVSHPALKRTNIWYRVQLVTQCSPTNDNGDWLYLGDAVWVSSAGVTDTNPPVPISGSAYPEAPCHSWVYQIGGPGSYLDPDSNVVDFVG